MSTTLPPRRISYRTYKVSESRSWSKILNCPLNMMGSPVSVWLRALGLVNCRQLVIIRPWLAFSLTLLFVHLDSYRRPEPRDNRKSSVVSITKLLVLPGEIKIYIFVTVKRMRKINMWLLRDFISWKSVSQKLIKSIVQSLSSSC